MLVKLHTLQGQEIIADSRCHILDYELGMAAWFSGTQIRAVDTPDGVLTWDAVKGKVRRGSSLFSSTGLVALENTHNMAGGTIYPLSTINDICTNAHALGIPVHMDGARVFNASVASGIPVAEITRNVDSVMFCLSKGLGAPAGSILAGSAAVMAQARTMRKRLGGGMRQVGVLAAAGIVALDTMVDRLAEDHANAKYLATELAHVPGLRVDVEKVQTNIVFIDVAGLSKPAPEISAMLKARGVLINNVGPSQLRIVTHCDAPREHCEVALAAVRDVAAELKR